MYILVDTINNVCNEINKAPLPNVEHMYGK